MSRTKCSEIFRIPNLKRDIFYLDQSFCPQNSRFDAASPKVAPREIQIIITERKNWWYGGTKSVQGRSSVYFVPNKFNIGSEIYLRECVKKRLMPFLKKAYPDNSALFWPDKAQTHYANMVKNFLAARNVKMVEWKNNPTSLPKHAQLNAIGPALIRSYIPIQPFPRKSRRSKKQPSQNTRKFCPGHNERCA